MMSLPKPICVSKESLDFDDDNKVVAIGTTGPEASHTGSVDDVENRSGSLLVGEHDAIIAYLLVKKHGDNLIFDTTKKQWKVFSDGMWHGTEEAARMVMNFYYRMILDISEGKYPDLQIGEENWLKSSMNQSKQASVLKIVQTLTAQGVETFDANHDLIGIQDMVYDINATAPRSAVAADLVFKSLGTAFDANAQCPQWEQFLNAAMQGDQEMINYLRRLVGYFLTASTKEQEIYYFYGSGANGKSTFLDLIKTLLGSYGVKVTSDSFMKNRGGARSLGTMASLANLAGARLALTDETSDSDVAFDTQTLKSISGDDEITGRFLRHNPITFKSTAKVVMYGNDKPYGNINDEGFWRRFRFIHFGHVIPADQRDKDLLDKLKDELPGILNWALSGLKDWCSNGIQTPQKIIDEGIEYREGLDSVTEFLKENTVLDADHRISIRQLYDQYGIWCRDNLKVPEEMNGFSKRAARYFAPMKEVDSFRNSKMRGYKGIRLS